MSRQDRKQLGRVTAELEAFGCDMLSTTLPMNASSAYALFCDIQLIPEWLRIVQSVAVLGRDGRNRVTRASFVALLERGSLGYSLVYEYDASALSVEWRGTDGQLFQARGSAQFQPMGDRASLMHYDLAVEDDLHGFLNWQDPLYGGHPASAVVHDFRDYVKRHRCLPRARTAS